MASVFTVAELDAQLVVWKAALLAAASGQSYTISAGGSSRSLSRNDLTEIRNTIAWLASERANAARTRGRTGYVVPS